MTARPRLVFSFHSFGADIAPVDGSGARSVITIMGDNLESADDHAVETPSAEHLSDAAVDRPTPSTGTPPSRSNSPAAGDSESTNANLGALQVVSSPTAAHDETWNSFLDVCPFPTLSTITSSSLVLRLHFDSTETCRRGRGLKGQLVDAFHLIPPTCTYTTSRVDIDHLPNHHSDVFVYRLYPPQASPRTSQGSPCKSTP